MTAVSGSPKEWLSAASVSTFLIMGILGAGSCSWKFSLEFAPLALPVIAEAPEYLI